MSLDAKVKLVPVARELCRRLRREATNGEQIFWEEVKNRKFLGLKFYRQYPIFVDDDGRETFLIADFYCHERRLVVEIDGRIHDFQKSHDQLREQLIRNKRIVVRRFRNEEVEGNIQEVMKKLEHYVHELSPTPLL